VSFEPSVGTLVFWMVVLAPAVWYLALGGGRPLRDSPHASARVAYRIVGELVAIVERFAWAILLLLAAIAAVAIAVRLLGI
jgi:hypothetical protein